MTYTVTKLVTNAYSLANIVSRDFETLEGNQLDLGVELLNDVLGDKPVEEGMVPYQTNDTFTGVIGQEAYPIDDLISVDTVTYLIGDLRYPMRFVDKDRYFGLPKATGINTLPYWWTLLRNFGGATIYMWYAPSDTYTFEYTGIKRLAEVANNQDLSLTLDRFYINYLKYELMSRLCQEFNTPIPKDAANTLDGYRRKINKMSNTIDTTMKKISTLNRYTGINYADINFADGWRP